MKKLLIVCGQTATGKTEIAIKLAKKFNSELVSADSRQVYKGMDIGTGKDLPQNSEFRIQNSKLKINDKFSVGYYEINGIYLWLYDIVSPDQWFSVADYYELAWKVIEDIWKRGKLPILVGGTGFYIKALIEGIGTMGVGADFKLRGELEKRTVEELQNELIAINPKKWQLMNNSDRNNKRRLIRAIEIAKNSEPIPGNNLTDKADLLTIGLTASKEELKKKIEKRVDKRIKQGIITEINGLLKKGYSWDLPVLSGMGYREWKAYFVGGETEVEVMKKWQLAEYQYAKRQLTWFKKEKNINWFDIGNKGYFKGVVALVSPWRL